MSFLDKLVDKMTPPESDQDRADARTLAEGLARNGDWLSLALEHHRRIESSFTLAMHAATAQERIAAMRELGAILNAHAAAEEVVLYPALTEHGEKAHAMLAYEEQTMTKVELARLEKLDPMGQDWQDKLGHIHGAVLHHIYSEEGTWFPELRQAVPGEEDAMLTRRFRDAFETFSGRGGEPGQGTGSESAAPHQMAAQIDESNRAPGAQNWGAADY